MKMTLKKNEFLRYVIKQTKTLFPDGAAARIGDLKKHYGIALDRTEHCFSKINSKYYSAGKSAAFDHLNGDHYAMFLYIFSNTLYRGGCDIFLCSKLFLLNKALHGIDAFYEVELPDIFLFVHPLGTVLGRAKYSDYLIVYQRCGVGSNHDIYPSIGGYTTLRPGSSILGKCRIGKNCTIAVGSLLIDKDLDSNSVYIGNPKNFIIKKSDGIQQVWKR